MNTEIKMKTMNELKTVKNTVFYFTFFCYFLFCTSNRFVTIKKLRSQIFVVIFIIFIFLVQRIYVWKGQGKSFLTFSAIHIQVICYATINCLTASSINLN